MNPLQMLQQVFGNNDEEEDGDSETKSEDSESTIEGEGDEFSDFSTDDEDSSVKNSSPVKLYKFKLFNFREVRPRSGPRPKPRSGHRIVYHKGKIFSFGGFNPSILADDPSMDDDIFWRDSRPLFKAGLALNSEDGYFFSKGMDIKKGFLCC